jgi:hypothetical protein
MDLIITAMSVSFSASQFFAGVLRSSLAPVLAARS